ncbi:MAG TPA: hemolysin family protein [Pseudomonadota bacterium]|jgi:CBS domain containing-hemolysin-like protein|nr:hemolysin family protein [Pseudomonadota bacterium]
MIAEAEFSSRVWQDVIQLLSHLLLLLPLFLSAGFFSGTETALLSLSRTRREVFRQNAATDPASARVVWLLSDPRRLITTIIIGNELTNILLSEVMTDSVAQVFRLVPRLQFGLTAASLDVLVAMTATVLTVPLLVTFGELIPKTVGIKLADRWARLVSWLLKVLTWVLWVPRVAISAISDLLLLVFVGPKSRHTEAAPVLSEREIRTLVDLGQQEGEIRGAERKLIHNVLDFGDLTVGNLMTTEKKVFALPVTMPLSRIVEAVSKQRYSRVPVYRGRRDNIVGILLAKDLVGYSYGDLEGQPLVDLLHPPLFVPRRAKCERLLREFQKRKTHMAMVVDEYGRLAGLVTMEDLLRPLFADLARTPTLQPATSGEVPPVGKGEG